MRYRRLLLVIIVMIAAAGLPSSQDNRDFELMVGDSQTAITRPINTQNAVLAAIQEEGRVEVRALTETILHTSDPSRILELQGEVIAVKETNRERFLTTLAEIADQNGNFKVRDEALRQIEILKNPPLPVLNPVYRELPDKDRQAKDKRP